MRLIDADALLEAVIKIYGDNHAPQGIVNLIANAPTIQREGWVSVEDRLPELEGKEYLVYGKCTDDYYRIDIANFWMGKFEKTNQPTHWQPVPAAPTETE